MHSVERTKILESNNIFIYSEVQALQFPEPQISWVSEWVCDFSPWASSALEVAKETKFGTKVAYGMRMMPELRIHACHTWWWKIITTE